MARCEGGGAGGVDDRGKPKLGLLLRGRVGGGECRGQM